MKIFLLGIIFYSSQIIAQSKLYDINIRTIDGTPISMADYKGKKIVVSSLSPDNMWDGQLAFLDSLQVSNPAVIVIAVPATDFKGSNDSLEIESLKGTSHQHVIITAADLVKKVNGSNQNRLLQWLTNASQNTHFDSVVTTDAQLYMISESGVFYGVLEKGTLTALINQLLKQQDVKQ